jgi:hypothetical protein
VRQERGARWIVLGHHADDQAETLLLRLARGSGLVGAGAMAPVTADGFVRPLLGERRDGLRAYLRAIGQDWREDATNAEGLTERNRIRLDALPALERARPGATAQLARAADRLRRDGDLLRAAVESLLPAPVRENGGPWRVVPRSLWAAAGSDLRRHLLRQAAWSVAGTYPPASWTDAWADWPERRGARPDLPWLRLSAAAEGAVLHARPPGPADAVVLPPQARWRLTLPGGGVLAAAPAEEGAVREAAGAGLRARPVLAGDRLGGRSVRDILRQRGVPAPCRGASWVVADGAGRVLWLPAGGEDDAVLSDGAERAIRVRWQAKAPAPAAAQDWPDGFFRRG